jgi:hypothetical protein
MSLKPMGDDAWPEHVAIQELGFHLSDNSLNSLKGQEFHRVIGLQNVSHEARQFIQMRLKAS